MTRPPTAPPPLDPHAALFIDVDGTLLEIAPRPELVEVAPSLPDLLRRLGDEREGALALISGRPIAELDRLFRPWRGAAAGLHGIERRRPDGSYAKGGGDADRTAAAALDRLRPEITAVARHWPGVFVEDKGRVIAAFMAEPPFQGRRPVYLGDDTTDEDGFAEVNRRGGVSIRIGCQSGSTAAVFGLSSVRGAREWLAGAPHLPAT